MKSSRPEAMAAGRRGARRRGFICLVLSTFLTAACSAGDPGYAVAVRNDSDAALVVRGRGPAHVADPRQWLLPPHTSGRVLIRLGPPREAPPVDYEIVDLASCRVVAIQRVDFARAPDPGYSVFVVTVAADGSVRLDTLTSADQAISGDLEATDSCPAA